MKYANPVQQRAEKVKRIMEMGFDEKQAFDSLKKCNDDENKAV